MILSPILFVLQALMSPGNCQPRDIEPNTTCTNGTLSKPLTGHYASESPSSISHFSADPTESDNDTIAAATDALTEYTTPTTSRFVASTYSTADSPKATYIWSGWSPKMSSVSALSSGSTKSPCRNSSTELLETTVSGTSSASCSSSDASTVRLTSTRAVSETTIAVRATTTNVVDTDATLTSLLVSNTGTNIIGGILSLLNTTVTPCSNEISGMPISSICVTPAIESTVSSLSMTGQLTETSPPSTNPTSTPCSWLNKTSMASISTIERSSFQNNATVSTPAKTISAITLLTTTTSYSLLDNSTKSTSQTHLVATTSTTCYTTTISAYLNRRFKLPFKLPAISTASICEVRVCEDDYCSFSTRTGSASTSMTIFPTQPSVPSEPSTEIESTTTVKMTRTTFLTLTTTNPTSSLGSNSTSSALVSASPVSVTELTSSEEDLSTISPSTLSPSTTLTSTNTDISSFTGPTPQATNSESTSTNDPDTPAFTIVPTTIPSSSSSDIPPDETPAQTIVPTSFAVPGDDISTAGLANDGGLGAGAGPIAAHSTTFSTSVYRHRVVPHAHGGAWSG